MTPIHQALAQKEMLLGQHLVDSGYVSGTVIADSFQIHGVEVIGPTRPGANWQKRDPNAFKIEDFAIHWEEQYALCPQRQKSTSWLLGHSPEGIPVTFISFPRQACQACEAKSRCTHSNKDGRSLSVLRQNAFEALHSMRRQQETPEWKALYHLRSGIEGTVSLAVRAHRARTARYRGAAKLRLQGMATAAGINLGRYLCLVAGHSKSSDQDGSFRASSQHCLTSPTVSLPHPLPR